MSITDTFTPPYNDIVDLDYYSKLYNKPHTEKEAIQNEQFSKLLIQVTDQINVLCGGRVYDEWAKLDDTKQADAKRKFWLRRAVCAYLEYCIDTAHIFVNKQFQSSGTLPFSVNASANDANFENTRHDIIKLLKQGGWYQTLYGINPTDKSCGEMSKIEYNQWLTWLVQYLKTIFKTTDNTNQFSNGLVLSNQEITTVGNITAYSNLSKLIGFDLSQSNIPQLLDYLTKAEATTTYQTINDNALLTTNKTIVGAINELASSTPAIINWDTAPTAGHGTNYAVTSEGIKTYVDTKETNLQSQITTNATAISTEIGHREDEDTYLQSQITTNANNIELKQNITDNNLQTTSKEVVGAINELKTNQESTKTDIVNNFIKVALFTSSQETIPAGQTVRVDIPITIPNGYEFVCCISAYGNGFVLPLFINHGISDQTKIATFVYNSKTTDASGTVSALVLIQKTSLN